MRALVASNVALLYQYFSSSVLHYTVAKCSKLCILVQCISHIPATKHVFSSPMAYIIDSSNATLAYSEFKQEM